MSKFFEKLLGRKPEREKKPPENLSSHEIARQIRDIDLDLISYGAVTSDKPIPKALDARATPLAVLLRYSPTLLKHLRTLDGILRAPNEFQIVDRPGKDWDGDEPDGDIIFHSEGASQIYTFAQKLMLPYLNSWRKEQASSNSWESLLYVDITLDFFQHGGRIWITSYRYSTGGAVSSDSIATSPLYPERKMTLQFWHSAERLSGEYFQDHFPGSEGMKKHIRFVEHVKTDGFHCFIFHYDADSHAGDLEKSQPRWEKEANFLRKKSNLDFSIVELGTVDIGGQKHWIYSGSEQTQVEVKQENKARNSVLRTALQGV